MKYVASCSFGKDSLAMVLLLLEKKYPLDEVIFYDTGMEFQAIYNNQEKLSKILIDKGIKFTVLKDSKSFTYKAFEKEVKMRNDKIKYGYNWCGGIARWGTSGKLSEINKHYKEVYGNEPIIEYVGIAVDEHVRIERSRINRQKHAKIYPLVEWNMEESDCLQYCYSHGWNWNEKTDRKDCGFVDLYEILDRVSCWCCANKNQKELNNMYHLLPEYWDKLKWYESTCNVPYKGKGMKYFEQKFDSTKCKE